MAMGTEATRDARVAAGAPIADGHRGESRRQHAIMLVGLAALARLARDRRFHMHLIMFAVGLAAAASLGRGTRANVFAHLAALDRAQGRRYQRRVKPPQP